MKLIKLLKSII